MDTLTRHSGPPVTEFIASPETPVLILAPPEPAFGFGLHRDWLIYHPTEAYKAAGAALAIQLAVTDPAVAAGIARITISAIKTDDDMRMPITVATACQLLKVTEAGGVKLEQAAVDDLSRALKEANEDCSVAAPPGHATK